MLFCFAACLGLFFFFFFFFFFFAQLCLWLFLLLSIVLLILFSSFFFFDREKELFIWQAFPSFAIEHTSLLPCTTWAVIYHRVMQLGKKDEMRSKGVSFRWRRIQSSTARFKERGEKKSKLLICDVSKNRVSGVWQLNICIKGNKSWSTCV